LITARSACGFGVDGTNAAVFVCGRLLLFLCISKNK
jgi:hypothetical protein